jgi:hypothetical protein
VKSQLIQEIPVSMIETYFRCLIIVRLVYCNILLKKNVFIIFNILRTYFLCISDLLLDDGFDDGTDKSTGIKIKKGKIMKEKVRYEKDFS